MVCVGERVVRGPGDPIARMPSWKSRAKSRATVNTTVTAAATVTLILQHHQDIKSPLCMLLWRPFSPLLHMMTLVAHHLVLLPPVRLF